MALIPLAALPELAALLDIRTWHPADVADLAVLEQTLARRTALALRRHGGEGGRPAAGYERLLD